MTPVSYYAMQVGILLTSAVSDINFTLPRPVQDHWFVVYSGRSLGVMAHMCMPHSFVLTYLYSVPVDMTLK